MELLSHLLRADPTTPRLTVYNEATGARLDFSAQTLDNWAAKVGNMLIEELDLDEDSTIAIDLPVSWQAAVVVLGALAAGIEVTFGQHEADAVFTTPDRYETHQPTGDVLLVSDDPFGRGIVESGGALPAGTIDFGPTVRFYGDHFFAPTRALTDIVSPSENSDRVLSTGWSDEAGFITAVLVPLSSGGSAVVVAGLTNSTRLDQIAAAEKVTRRLS